MNKRIKLLNSKNHEWAVNTLWFTLISAVLIFLPNMVAGRGIFCYMGDYDAQQIPFYVHCHDMVRNGVFGWDWGTELGTNFIGSYTYYTLCSPFFWLTVPFPTSWVPYLMGPLFILKFVCSAMAAYAYLRYMTKTGEGACIGSLLYALSGWSLYNIFYNQFHESFIAFPLLLLALEKLVKENKRGFFAAMVAVSAVVNYYFFVGMVIFLMLYWLVKTVTKSWEMSLKTFFVILGEGVLGALISAVVMIPSALCVFGMPRTSDWISGWNFWVYDSPIYLCILQSLFFPPEIPAIQSFNDYLGVAWQSLSLYLPFVGPIAVFAFMKANKKSWITKLLIVCAVFALVPGLNASFTLFNSTYYARWFMMPILMMSLASARMFEDSAVEDFLGAYKSVGFFTLVYVLIESFTPIVYPDGTVKIGLFNRTDPSRFCLYIFWVGVVVLQFLVMYNLYSKKRLEKMTVLAKKTASVICAFAVLIAGFSLTVGRMVSCSSRNLEYLHTFSQLDSQYVQDNSRISVTAGEKNVNMYKSGLSNTDCFHSVVSGSTFDFYQTTLDFERNVVSPNTMTDACYKALTSVRYVFVDKTFVDSYEDCYSTEDSYIEDWEESFKRYGYIMMPGYKEIDSFGDVLVYENEYWIPIGQAYEYYITESEYEKLPEKDRTFVALSALVVPDSDVESYSDCLEDFMKTDETKRYSEDAYFAVCRERAEMGGTDFQRGKNRFSATTVSEKEQYVLFSVPYEKDGWSATVNGKDAEIHVVDGGLMAVRVEAGENEIEFTYHTPGLRIGACVSLVSFLVLAAYVVVVSRKRKS